MRVAFIGAAGNPKTDEIVWHLESLFSNGHEVLTTNPEGIVFQTARGLGREHAVIVVASDEEAIDRAHQVYVFPLDGDDRTTQATQYAHRKKVPVIPFPLARLRSGRKRRWRKGQTDD
jgi:hypothetical protein